MTNKSATPENAISRRHFLLSASLATTALGFEPLTGMAAPVQEPPVRADTPGKLCLWSDRPAQAWMTEALPLGNGPLGAMLFGGTEIERVQFNEISLWGGTRMAVEGLDDEGQDLGAYQAFGDILIHLGHDFSKVTDYRQELDIDRAVHQVTYESNGVRYQRTAFASHPDGVIVIQLTANKPAAYTGRVQLTDMHQARIAAAGNTLSAVGKLENGFEYEAQLMVLNENGTVAVKDDEACAKNPWDLAVPAASLAFEQCAGRAPTSSRITPSSGSARIPTPPSRNGWIPPPSRA
ncbi:MAG: glycoside hydrolase family 95 protein [Verrucomicrobia bacterium]|nr:glycoside hydrolase family 95 protein [Verrucomicrobiota bacterium]